MPSQQEHGWPMVEVCRAQAPSSAAVVAQSGSRFRLKVRGVVRWYLRPLRGTHVVCVDGANPRATACWTPSAAGPAGTPGGALPTPWRPRDSGGPPCPVGSRAGTRATTTQCLRVPRTSQGAPCSLPSRSLGRHPRQSVDLHYPGIRAWLAAQQGGVRFAFVPIRASWLNQIEIWFSILVRQLRAPPIPPASFGRLASGASSVTGTAPPVHSAGPSRAIR